MAKALGSVTPFNGAHLLVNRIRLVSQVYNPQSVGSFWKTNPPGHNKRGLIEHSGARFWVHLAENEATGKGSQRRGHGHDGAWPSSDPAVLQVDFEAFEFFAASHYDGSL